MKRISMTKEQLIAENEELQSRLIELEEALAAIRSGEVDAIVVTGSKGEQVYSINSAETPYRSFIEEMNEGAVTLTREGVILFCNRRFADLVQEPVEHVIGAYFQQFITQVDISPFVALLSQQSQAKNDDMVVSLVNKIYLKLSFHLLPPYLHGENCILIATDISEIKKKENDLLALHRVLEKRLGQLKELRLELINAKIEAKAENSNLKKENKKLVREFEKVKLEVTELKLKLKQIKVTI